MSLWTRLVLLAYPRRWRAAHGEEMAGLLADVYGGGRLGVRASADLVRAGWVIRWRDRPTVWRFLAYRYFAKRLPDNRGWVEDDIGGRLYPLRDYLWSTSLLVPVLLVVRPGDDGQLPLWLVYAVLAAVILLITWRRSRRSNWRWHLSPSVPSPLPGLAPVARRPRPRIPTGPWVTVVWLACLVGGAASVGTTVLSGAGDRTVLIASAVALTLGAVVAVIGALLAQSELRHRPEQPLRSWREVPVRRTAWVAATVVVVLASTGLVSWLAPLPVVAGIGALVVGPVLATVDVLARRAWRDGPVALSDVLGAMSGQAIRVDEQIPVWATPSSSVYREPSR